MVSSNETAVHCQRCGDKLGKGKDGEGRERIACARPGCGFVFYGNPVPVVAAVVTRGDADCVLVRSRGWPDGWYGLVTGFLERGETVLEGVLREVEEEVGSRGVVRDFLGVYDFPRLNQIYVAYHLEIEAGAEVRIDERELEGYKIVPLDELRSFPGPTGRAVAEILRRRAAQRARKGPAARL